MARKNNRGSSVRLTRPPQALGHTVSRFRDSDETSDFGYLPSLVRSPLIRTVLVNPAPPSPRRFQGNRKPSPILQSRATGRSSDRQTRSPFLNATMLTPELTFRAVHCAQRTIRREVLFARKKTGKGSQSPKRTRSKVRC